MKYPIDRVFHKFPSYYRRGAIAFAVGQVSSFVSRYREWQSGIRSKRDAKPPTLNANAGCYPVLYKGQCYKLHGSENDMRLIATNCYRLRSSSMSGIAIFQSHSSATQ
ncbi:hypothetical protein NDI52_17730 [Leptolyngbya sp. PL-A3]